MCLPRLVIPDLLWAKIRFCCHLDTKRALGVGTDPLSVPTVPGPHKDALGRLSLLLSRLEPT